MNINEYNMDNYKDTYLEWYNRHKDIHKPLCPEDLCLGWGITLDYTNVNTELISNLIEKYNDYIWIRQYGLIECVHYTMASTEQLRKYGLKGSDLDEKDNTLTFAGGVYVYNKAQHKPDKNKPYVTFWYYGEYYVCVYDCDPDKFSKDIGMNQEYLLPTMNIPAKYLNIPFNSSVQFNDSDTKASSFTNLIQSIDFCNNNIDSQGQLRHNIISFLKYLNSKSKSFILKGSFAINLLCGRKSFIDNIELEGYNDKFFEILKDYITYQQKLGDKISFECLDNTNGNQCVLIKYPNNQSVTINVILSNNTAYPDDDKLAIVDEITMYPLNQIAKDIINRLGCEFDIQDLIDITYIYSNYQGYITHQLLYSLKNILQEMNVEDLVQIMRDRNIDETANEFITMNYDLESMQQPFHFNKR